MALPLPAASPVRPDQARIPIFAVLGMLGVAALVAALAAAGPAAAGQAAAGPAAGPGAAGPGAAGSSPAYAEPGAAAIRGLVAFADPEGDTQFNVPAVPLAPPYDAGVDIVAAGLDLDGSDFVAWIQLTDLSAVANTDVGAFPDTMFIVRWQAEGPGGGDWELRADYQPMNSPPWSFRGEGPSDTFDELSGAADMANSTVRIHLALDAVANLPATTFGMFEAATDAVWPTWPVYAGDRAQDLNATKVAFREAPASAGSPSGSPGNGTSEPGSGQTGEPGPSGSGSSGSSTKVVDLPAPTPEAVPEPAPAASKDAPGVGMLAMVVLLALARGRRARASGGETSADPSAPAA